MARKALPETIEAWQERLDRTGRPPTSDDVSITMDGRRLDSKEAVLAWLADYDEAAAEERFQQLPRRGSA